MAGEALATANTNIRIRPIERERMRRLTGFIGVMVAIISVLGSPQASACARQSDIPGAAEALRSWPEQFEKSTKLPWNKLLESLGGEAGLLLTLGNEHTVELPMGTGGRIALPAPACL